VRTGGTRPIAVLAVAALLALSLVACGSSDSGSSGSNSTGGPTSAQDNGSGGGTEGENDAGESQPEEGGNSGAGKSSSDFTPEEVETPLKVSGGGSEQFRTRGGDNSIQEFGAESDESELQAAAETVHSFFVARASGDWGSACSYLSKAMREQLEQLAASSTTLKDKGCASFLQAFTSHLSAQEWRDITTVDAGSLRLDGEEGFLIYYGAEDTAYAMPLTVEDDDFKVGALAGDALG
jgi:hypothetical protein